MEAYKRLEDIKNKELTYKDETGTILFGQAVLQRHTESLEKNQKELRFLNTLLSLSLILGVICIGVLIYLIKYKHFIVYAGRQFLGG